MPAEQLPDGVRIEEGDGALVRLALENDVARATVYAHGAHVTEWTPKGRRPVLWVSPLSPFAPGKAIRGGIPICFPWFGARATDPAAPAHGLARLAAWQLESASRREDHTRVTFTLQSGDVPPHGLHWSARYVVEFGGDLGLTLEVGNVGEVPLTFEEALHTYYAVGDAREALVSGLEGTEYLDKPAGLTRKRQDDGPIRFGGEVDRVYLATRAACVINDPVWQRRIRVEKSGSESTVVWNPGPVRGAAMPEVQDGWTAFVCVETCNVGAHAVTLPPGARHSMSARVTL